MIELIAATCGGFLAGWICRELQRPMGPPKGSYGYRPRGSNPPPPGRKPPAPPAPPYSSAAIAWQAEDAQRAAELYAKFIDPSMGVPWEEGHTQRGNGHGGPSTPKPPIKPQPPSSRIIDASGMTIGYRPLPWPGTPNPPPEAP